MVSFCMLAGWYRVRYLMLRPYGTLDRQWFGLRIIGRLLALCASCIFSLRHHASWTQTGFSHWWVPTVSVWGLLLPWLLADSILCKLSLQLVFGTLLGASWLCFPSWSLLKETAFGMCMSSILVTWPAQCDCTFNKMDSTLGRLASLIKTSFDV